MLLMVISCHIQGETDFKSKLDNYIDYNYYNLDGVFLVQLTMMSSSSLKPWRMIPNT